MGLLDNEPPFAAASVELETFNWASVPAHYVTGVWKTEAAGGECVRAYLIEEMGKLVVPRYTFIMPARNIVTATMTVQRAALEIFQPPCRPH